MVWFACCKCNCDLRWPSARADHCHRVFHETNAARASAAPPHAKLAAGGQNGERNKSISIQMDSSPHSSSIVTKRPVKIVALVSLLTLQASATNEKKSEKRPTKKASSAKPTKTPKSIVEEFTGLPPEDVDFIKELDRQFTEHGNKIRIKVQRENSTGTKSSKRTIDGDLGYGHYSNQPEGGYHFSKPKYMLYPYAQHNVPVKATHTNDETVTELEIQPSHSYELKPIEEVYQIYPTGAYQQASREQYYHEQQHHHYQQQDDNPVIVLKIPGPAKYAQHLQALLQQYLEIRAAQLYKEIQEQEYHHQQQAIQLQQQQLIQQQQQHYHHQPQQQYHHQQHQHHAQHETVKYSQPDPYQQPQEVYVPAYKPTSYPQSHYYESHKKRPTQPTYHKPTPTHIVYQASTQPDHQAYQYETYHQQHETPQHQVQIQYQYVHQQAAAAPEEHQEYVYPKPGVNFVTPVPDQEEHHEHHYQPPAKYQNFAQYHAHHQPEHHDTEEYLPEPKLVENYPSDKHTRVVYKSQALKAQLQQEVSHDQEDYVLHQHHQSEHGEGQEQQQYIYQTVYSGQAMEDKSFVEPVTPEAINDLHGQGSSPAPEIEPRFNTETVVSITQKPKRIYNYHANSVRSHRRAAASNKNESGSRSDTDANEDAKSNSSKSSNKRDAPYTEEQFKKINKMVHRIKKKSQSISTTARSVVSTTKRTGST
ncbi:putative mediator of RNA polymerase II transcription subunit 26 [Sabethes cyaneus]|uniref:putative mediator of RNA polymerase II transcription subunit 26 n=1 Tax=Sabethes cyaneus TaxID=53552 RepID=UPI00237DD5B7|nr:putative mediator of RNA polymerase II transcription subunit 26 [Sabethes cyaneus]